MAVGGAEQSEKRQLVFKKHLKEIIGTLNDYIEQTNEQGKNGWQAQAVLFSQEIVQLEYCGSLYLLRDKTLTFCKSLRSSYNYYSSSLFGDRFVQSLGSYVGVGRGSDLKENLTAIAKGIEPLNAEYISQDILLIAIYKPPFSIEKLLPESMRALTEIASDPKKEEVFYEQSKTYYWNIQPEYLLGLIKEQSKPKASTRCFFS